MNLFSLRIGLILLLLAQFSSTAAAQSKLIKTYAGPLLPTMGSQATTQAIDQPGQVAPDGAGGFYVASYLQHRVYRVAADGSLWLIAGTGIAGSYGDGGLAIQAQLYAPSGLALDSARNLYIADTQNHRIRKVTPDGIISTVAGNGTWGHAGDGNIATAAQLYMPYGVAVDSGGNIFIADTNNCMIREVTTDGIIHRIAGDGTWGFGGDGGLATAAQLNFPHGLAMDPAGNLFIADTINHRIRIITPAGIISTIAGNGTGGFGGDGGTAIAAQLYEPRDVTIDSMGNIYIADYANYRIRMITPGGMIRTVAGNGTAGFSGDGGFATAAQLNQPSGVSIDSMGKIYISDERNNRIRAFWVSGAIETVAGNGTWGFSGDGGPATAAKLYCPSGLVGDSSGNLYIADTCNDRIRMIAPNGTIRTVAGNGSPAGIIDGIATSVPLFSPWDVAADSEGNIYVAQPGINRICKFTVGGTISTVAGNGYKGFSGDGGPATAAQLNAPWGIAADSAGNIYIADTSNHRIRKVSPDNLISTVAGNGTAGFSGDGGPATAAQLSQPNDVAVDSAGILYIADSGNQRVRIVRSDGTISTFAGNGGSNSSGDGGPATAAQLCASGLTVDSRNNLFVADSCNHRIRKITPAGIISSVAGNGARGFGGDEGWAVEAQLNFPYRLAVDYRDNLYIADNFNNRVRVLVATFPVVTTTIITSIRRTTASGGGAIILDGGDDVTVRGICWSTSANPTTSDRCTSNGTGTGTFVGSIVGLNGGTAYHVRAYAANSVGTAYGVDVPFTTLDLPTVTTAAITSITPTSASGGGNVTADGGASVTARGVCWSIWPNPTTADTCTRDGTGNGIFASSISGLSAGTAYHVRAYATNSEGTVYGADVPFRTVGLPTVTTAEITSITPTSARGGGTVTDDGGGSVTARGVCWSISTNPSSANTCTNDGTGAGVFVSSISGLSAGTAYHVRAYATNAAGTTYGADLVFATADFQLSAVSGGSLSATVNAGASAVYNLAVTGINAFSGSVSFACDSGLPSAASCSISPNPLTVSNSTSVPFSVTINTTGRTTPAGITQGPHFISWGRSAQIAVLSFCSLGLILSMQRRRWLSVAFLSLTAIGFVGCGGGGRGGSPRTLAGTYTVVLTATSSNINHSINLTLTVR
jgi:sugar lactone lactonase YvrE